MDYGVELPVDTDAYNSVGGFVFAQLGRLPKRGDTVTADGYSIRVESVRENRIEAVRIRERKAPSQPAAEIRRKFSRARLRWSLHWLPRGTGSSHIRRWIGVGPPACRTASGP